MSQDGSLQNPPGKYPGVASLHRTVVRLLHADFCGGCTNFRSTRDTITGNNPGRGFHWGTRPACYRGERKHRTLQTHCAWQSLHLDSSLALCSNRDCVYEAAQRGKSCSASSLPQEVWGRLMMPQGQEDTNDPLLWAQRRKTCEGQQDTWAHGPRLHQEPQPAPHTSCLRNS